MPVSGKLSAEQVAEIIVLYQGGLTMSVISRRFGVARETVAYQLKKFAIPLRNTRPSSKPIEYNASGVIVSVKEQTSGRIHTLHAPGRKRDALEEIMETIDRDPGDWRIVSYSNPNTIVGDLHNRSPRRTFSPEYHALKQADRLDLLDPSLQPIFYSKRRP